MKTPKLKIITLALQTALSSGQVITDDGGNGEAGKPILKRMSKEETASVPGYIDEAEHAFIAQMKFYVPMQAASGALSGADPDANSNGSLYFDVDGELKDTRPLAKPLIGVQMFGPVIEVEGVGFIGHGKRDAYALISLDDGVTRKNTNLSESTSDTSCDNANCNVARMDVPLFANTGYNYPGDVTNLFHSIMGNRATIAQAASRTIPWIIRKHLTSRRLAARPSRRTWALIWPLHRRMTST